MHQKTIFFLVAVLLGAVNGWVDRYATFTDVISYLDMGDAMFRGDWGTAINAYWSPLYPFLLGFAMLVFSPSPYWELPTVQIVNFLVFVGACGAFVFFMDQVLLYHRRTLKDDCGETTALPEWALSGMGYALFLWSSFSLITSTGSSPDMCVSVLVYLAAGIILTIRGEEKEWYWYVGLGGILGFAYLAKAVMFPIGIVFLIVTFLLRKGNFHHISRTLFSVLTFALVTSPLVVSLSLEKGRFTFGESGKLNYIWHVNGVEHWVHWQGGPAAAGEPEHPTRQIQEKPAVYEFAQPVGGTYPPFQDPSYWYEGAKVEIAPSKLFRALIRNLGGYYGLTFAEQGGVIAGILIIFLMGERRKQSLSMILKCWPLIAPAGFALVLYLMADVRARYVGPFFVLFGVGILMGLRTGESPHHRKLAASVVVLMLGLSLIPVTTGFVKNLAGTGEGTSGQSSPRIKTSMLRASEVLSALGLRPGDKVAVIGSAWAPYWARLARVQIVAELPQSAYLDYWAAGEERKKQTLTLLAGTGAKAVVLNGPFPATADRTNWREIPHTDLHVMLIERR